jgi:hypothetical protein
LSSLLRGFVGPISSYDHSLVVPAGEAILGKLPKHVICAERSLQEEIDRASPTRLLYSLSELLD